MPDWIMKSATTGHPLSAILKDVNGPVDLPVGTTIKIRAKVYGASTPKILADASVVSPGALIGDSNRGKILYQPILADLDTPNVYEVDFLATIPGVGVQPFPEQTYMYLLILPGADTT